METTATSARELNIKVKNDIAAAKAAAKADMKKEIDHNIVTGKPLSSPKGKGKVDKPTVAPKETKAVAAKVVKPKLSEKIDELITKGGKWEDLISEATEFCKKNELKSKITQGSFKTQIYWRRQIQKQESYAADKVLTEKGIEKVTTKSKSKK